jgi:hypothetical protein
MYTNLCQRAFLWDNHRSGRTEPTGHRSFLRDKRGYVSRVRSVLWKSEERRCWA